MTEPNTDSTTTAASLTAPFPGAVLAAGEHQPPVSWLDHSFALTTFQNYAATTKHEESWTLRALSSRIKTTTAAAKTALPWLKLARFGDQRTDKNSLRHDGNVLAITGIEADYDLETITPESAIETLTKAGVLAMVYTSPSHSADKPRFRVLCPTSHELPPERRQNLMGRLNGLFRGVFSTESWTLSQAYYFGSVNHNSAHLVEIIDGEPIDLHDELDEIWQGKPGTSSKTTPAGQRVNGAVNEAELIEQIIGAETFHTPTTRLLGVWITRGVSYATAREMLLGVFDGVPQAAQNDRWRSRRKDVDRCLQDFYGKQAKRRDHTDGDGASAPDPEMLANPDMSVLRLGRRAPPALPLDVFGPRLAEWISDAAAAASAPVDYVASPLIAAASALVGNARWVQATEGWCEPPHIWAGVVGDSGTSKSPGADCLLRDVLPEIERRMLGDFPDRLREWKAAAEAQAATIERWKGDVKEATKKGNPPPLPPAEGISPEPQAPRLRQSDTTIERVATLLATAAPKGLLFVRDELAGWLKGMTQYNDAGRAFWLEAYGGRSYRVERQKMPEPIFVPRMTVAVTGGTQPEKLAEMFREADDGLLARFIWAWPEPLPFKLGRKAPNAAWAVDALDRLRLLELAPGEQPGDPHRPVNVPLSPAARAMMEAFGQDMQRGLQEAGGLLRSAYGKARGLALRLSLVLAMLRWCSEEGIAPPPTEIGEHILGDACDLVANYFIPMAERVFGDAAATQAERNAATLARWIKRERAAEVHVRRLQREVRLPGLGDAAKIHAAAAVLVEAGWLIPPEIGYGSQRKVAYAVNPVVLERGP